VRTPASIGTVQQLVLDRPASGGAVGRSREGQVVFARHGLPGERVAVEITEAARSFARGEVIDVLTASRDRVAPPCPYAVPFGCGGCDLQHATEEAQRRWKADVASEHLGRFLRRTGPIKVESAGEAKGSRTRIRCAVDENGRLAMRRSRTHDLIEIDDCWLTDPGLAPAFAVDWSGASEVELRAIGSGAPFAVVRPLVGRRAILTRTVTNEPLAQGQSTVEVGGHAFRVGPASFWQVHRRAPEVLLDAVLGFAGVGDGDRVADLYSGVGLFAVSLAKVVGARGSVTAVESSSVACADARYNARTNLQVGVRHGKVAPRTIDVAVRANDVVVMDPPRTGAGRAIMSVITAKRPRRIVYVSCDAATLARDLDVAIAAGFELAEFRTFDLFPMTEHLELVAVLDAPRRGGQSLG
jgi:tRNA/tmRNA/rRNA uracil-C5-methylase (TrmA/RlmC/RlmD family)